jgi:hypothetical protein
MEEKIRNEIVTATVETVMENEFDEYLRQQDHPDLPQAPTHQALSPPAPTAMTRSQTISAKEKHDTIGW